MLKSAKERLEIILKETRKTANGLAAAIGLIQPQGLYDIKNEKIKSISGEIAVCIYKTYSQFELLWILTGEGNMLISETKTNNSDPPQDLMDEIKRLKNDLENKEKTINNLNFSLDELRTKYSELEEKYNRLNAEPPEQTGTGG